jgi:apolipoprotein N-acyltransferase
LKAFLESPRAAIAAALAGGAVTVAGFAPVAVPADFSDSPGFSFSGCARELRHTLSGSGCVRRRLFGAGASWVYISLHDFGAMPAPLAALATVINCAILALYPAAAGWCLARLQVGRVAASVAAFPASWVFFEWMRGWMFTGVPWLAIGYSQVDSPLSGFGPVLGVYSVSFATVLCAGLVVAAVSGERRNRIACGAALVAVFGVGAALKTIAWTSPRGEPVLVALLQGNISQDLKFQAERYAKTLAIYRQLIESSRAQLIVLPETAIPRFLDAVDPGYLRDIARIAVERNADVLIGVPIRDPDGRYFNSDQPRRLTAQRYDKSHLVPFGEFVPPGCADGEDSLDPVVGFSSGRAMRGRLHRGAAVALISAGKTLSAKRSSGPAGATLLVNFSNVAWFGDRRSWRTSRSRMRASGRAPMLARDQHRSRSSIRAGRWWRACRSSPKASSPARRRATSGHRHT